MLAPASMREHAGPSPEAPRDPSSLPIGPFPDASLPPAMALAAERIGIEKAWRPWTTTFTLAVLAGAFIALGALFSTTVVAGAQELLPFGVARLLGGLAFSLGLVLVVTAGAELFTGNNLLVMAWLGGGIPTGRLVAHAALVYAGNFTGAMGTALLAFWGAQYRFGVGAVGAAALDTALAKMNLDWERALALGILCNALVCLAVWLTYGARTMTDRILAVAPPIAAFVAAGFEHSIANMYFLPLALLVKAGAPGDFWSDIDRTPGDFSRLEWDALFTDNLVPVTIGNVIGGAGLVGAVYWFVYLRARPPLTARRTPGSASPPAPGSAPPGDAASSTERPA